MKKFLLILAAVCCVATVSAKKSVVETAKSADWSVGLRVGSGIQADAECFFKKGNYVEARFGMGYLGGRHYVGVGADLQGLYMWQLYNWNWTPKVGKWFLDAGCGANLGGAAHWFYFGVAGSVKFGLKFKKYPIRLALDYTPVIGLDMSYPGKYYNKPVGLYGNGFGNVGLAATWCF